MANSNEEQQKKSSVKPTPTSPKTKVEVTQPAAPIATTPSTKGFSFHTLVTVAIILAVIALFCSLYSLKANRDLKEVITEKTQNVISELDTLRQQQLQTQGIEDSVTSLKQAQAKLQNQLKTVEKGLQIAMQQRLYKKEDWLLLKARYYLELAQINAHWSDDQQTTIAMLKAADDLLTNVSGQQLFAVRQAIAQEIAQLQALPKTDITGLLSKLDAAQDMVAKLPLKQPLNSMQPDMAQNGLKQGSSDWKEQLRASINSLEKLVVIRRHDGSIQPLLSPLHQAMLQETIRMNLEEAQWAILQNNPAVYQSALTQAIKNIKRAFDVDATPTQALLTQLQNLQQKKLLLSRPVINKSLPLLNQVIESNHSPTLSMPKEGDNQ